MTLTELSYYSRRMLPFGILFVLLILILFYSFRILLFLNGPSKSEQKVITKLFPGEKIQAPVITDASPAAGIAFSLDTIEGRPTTATLSAEIFVLEPVTTKFGFREKILLMAQTFGIDTDATKYKINDKDATFQDESHELSIDISTFNFYYQYDMQKDPELFVNTTIPSDEEIIRSAADFLKRADKYPSDFAQSKPSIIYYTYDPVTTELKISDVPDSTTNMIEVDFFRPDIEAIPTNLSTVTSKFPNSQNYVAMVFKDQDVKVLKAQVKYFETSKEQVGIYPLKTGDEAWEQLQSGKASVVNGAPNVKDVTIKKMFLAYYDPQVYQPYLQPVYVFIGSDNFVGYVPAVMDELLTK